VQVIRTAPPPRSWRNEPRFDLVLGRGLHEQPRLGRRDLFDLAHAIPPGRELMYRALAQVRDV
jgi:hypothetical protein